MQARKCEQLAQGCYLIVHRWTFHALSPNSYYFTIYLVLLSLTIASVVCPWSYLSQASRICISHVHPGRTHRWSWPQN